MLAVDDEVARIIHILYTIDELQRDDALATLTAMDVKDVEHVRLACLCNASFIPRLRHRDAIYVLADIVYQRNICHRIETERRAFVRTLRQRDDAVAAAARKRAWTTSLRRLWLASTLRIVPR